MSEIVIAGNTSGSVTIAAPDVAGTTTLTLPASSGTVLDDASVGVCRAWVNFNGTGTVAIRQAFNVSSITDNGVGDYTVNFTNSMVDADYCFDLSASDDGTTAGQTNGYAYGSWLRGQNSCAYSAGSIRFQIGYPANGTSYDQTHINVSVFR